MARVLITNSDLNYARAFFLAPPDVSALMAGETRSYPMKYYVGTSQPASAFELHWYATREDADAFRDRLTDTSRLPSVAFVPETPNTSTQSLQDGGVILTAPTTNAYENPVGVIEMVQDTGEYIKPHMYLTMDELVWDNSVEYQDYTFRYWVGNPAIERYYLEWYPTRRAANLRRNRLTDVSRLPRAVFTPEVPNKDAGAEEVQDGTLRLYPSESDNFYTKIEGLLCLLCLTTKNVSLGDAVRDDIVYSNWRGNQTESRTGSNWDRGR